MNDVTIASERIPVFLGVSNAPYHANGIVLI